MAEYKEIKDAFGKLPPLHQEQIVYECLLDGTFSFTTLSKLYVETLEEKAHKQTTERADQLMAVGMAWSSIKAKDWWARKKLAQVIVDSGFFVGADIHNECVEYLKEHGDE